MYVFTASDICLLTVADMHSHGSLVQVTEKTGIAETNAAAAVPLKLPDMDWDLSERQRITQQPDQGRSNFGMVGAVRDEVQHSITAGLMKTQMEDTVSEETRDSIRAALVRTQMEGTVSDEVQQSITAGLVQTQMEDTVSDEMQHSITAGLVRTQMAGTVSQQTQDSIRAGMMRTQMAGTVSEQTRDSIKDCFLHVLDSSPHTSPGYPALHAIDSTAATPHCTLPQQPEEHTDSHMSPHSQTELPNQATTSDVHGASQFASSLSTSGSSSILGVWGTELFDYSDRNGVAVTAPLEYVHRSSMRKTADNQNHQKPAADRLARMVLATADRHCKNGQLTVNELRTFLPVHPFTLWLLSRQGSLVQFDRNHDGVLTLSELRQACTEFLKEMPDHAEIDEIEQSDSEQSGEETSREHNEKPEWPKSPQTHNQILESIKERLMSSQRSAEAEKLRSSGLSDSDAVQPEHAESSGQMFVGGESMGESTTEWYTPERFIAAERMNIDSEATAFSIQASEREDNGSHVQMQMEGAISEEVQERIKAGLLRTQMQGTMSEEIQDSIKAGLLRTRIDSTVSEETQDSIMAGLSRVHQNESIRSVQDVQVDLVRTQLEDAVAGNTYSTASIVKNILGIHKLNSPANLEDPHSRTAPGYLHDNGLNQLDTVSDSNDRFAGSQVSPITAGLSNSRTSPDISGIVQDAMERANDLVQAAHERSNLLESPSQSDIWPSPPPLLASSSLSHPIVPLDAELTGSYQAAPVSRLAQLAQLASRYAPSTLVFHIIFHI